MKNLIAEIRWKRLSHDSAQIIAWRICVLGIAQSQNKLLQVACKANTCEWRFTIQVNIALLTSTTFTSANVQMNMMLTTMITSSCLINTHVRLIVMKNVGR
eukprot:2574327-Amphidinium_carterae.1